MTSEELIKKVKSLNLPEGKYVVVASGILTALGLREASDVDIVVDPEVLEKFRETGELREEKKYEAIFLHKDKVDLFSKLSWEDYPTTRKEAIETAKYIQGVPFLNIEETIKFKKALNREKDKPDIKLLEEYKANS